MYNKKPNNSVDILDLFNENKLVKICAPMVRYSKLQFRSLVREYGCDLCYTPMILADSICLSDKARNNEFTTNLKDSPLVVQFAANTVHDFVGASYMVSPYCNGVDLNCGCPQRWAKQMGIGCSLLDKPELIADLISQCRNKITKPFTVSVKLRILKDIKKTIEICKRLEKAGASYISVHARTPSQHTGDINLEALKLIVENVDCPVVGNGGIKNLEDCINLQAETKCKGVMVANSLLANPTLFTGSQSTTEECVQKWLDICYNSTLNTISYSNCDPSVTPVIPECPPNLTFQCFHHHLVFMLEKLLPRSKRRIFNNLQSFKDVLLFLYEHFGISLQRYDLNKFENSKILDLDYNNREEVYLKLKRNSVMNSSLVENVSNDYSYENSNGKFFKSKLVDDTDSIEYDL
ncbi:hypothetical protein ILUMI_12412, partial [Ignelater luminosus]